MVCAGTCRTSFHPICAREARHRLEVWGKYGCDNVRLFSLFPRICNFAVVIVAYLIVLLAYFSDETFCLKWLCYMLLQVELRAFCSKHSDIQDNSITPRTGDPCSAIGSDSCVFNNLEETLSMSKLHKLKISCKNGDKVAVHMETSDANSDRSADSEVTGFSDSRLISVPTSECTNAGMLDKSEWEDVNPSDALNFTLILKKVL